MVAGLDISDGPEVKEAEVEQRETHTPEAGGMRGYNARSSEVSLIPRSAVAVPGRR